MTAIAPLPAKLIRLRPIIRRPTHRWSPDVCLIEMPTGLRLADFGRDRFYALNGSAAELAQLALHSGPRFAIRALSVKYGVPAAEVRRDWQALSTELATRGLIEPLSDEQPFDELKRSYQSAAEAQFPCLTRIRRRFGRFAARALLAIAGVGRAPELPSAWRVKCLLWAAWLAVQSQSWRSVIQTWGDVSSSTKTEPHSQDRATQTQTIHDRVIAQAARSWLPVACKERALVAWRLLRLAGETTAQLVIGVADHPFRAHAWVECAGRILTDDPAHCEPFRPVVRYGRPSNQL